jgi:hypothetical protein
VPTNSPCYNINTEFELFDSNQKIIGFTPQTFRSSRKDRAKMVEQSVSDFLDSEDYEEGVGGKTLTTKEEFSDEKKYSANVSVLKGKRGVSEIFDIPNNNTNSTGLILSTFIPPI